MSGGSMDYLCFTLDERAKFPCDSPERSAFRKHLDLVVKALHDIEWVDSGDYGKGDEIPAIMACIQRSDVVQAALTDAKRAHEALGRAIVDAEASRK